MEIYIQWDLDDLKELYNIDYITKNLSAIPHKNNFIC